MEKNIETIIKEIDEIVKKLENNKNTNSIDESIQLFEKGTKLINEADSKLKIVKAKVVKIIESNSYANENDLDSN